jgi:hypothetical protein
MRSGRNGLLEISQQAPSQNNAGLIPKEFAAANQVDVRRQRMIHISIRIANQRRDGQIALQIGQNLVLRPFREKLAIALIDDKQGAGRMGAILNYEIFQNSICQPTIFFLLVLQQRNGVPGSFTGDDADQRFWIKIFFSLSAGALQQPLTRDYQ